MTRWPRLLDVLHAGPAWPLGRYLLLALALRLPAVWWARGYEYIDQQYQSVDPAWHLATGLDWHPTWEWIDGIRSWVYPHLLAAVFRAAQTLGCTSPAAAMAFARGAHALVSLLPLALFWLLIVRWRPVAAPRLPLLLVAVSGLFVTIGVQPSASALAATFAVASAIACAGPGRWPACGGLLLGFAFACRFQEALFGPALVAALLWQRRWRAAIAFAVGCLPGILVQGFSDVAAYGRFLHSPFAYVHSNLVLGAAAKWRAQPWWFYLAAGVAPLLVMVPPLLRTAWSRLAAGAAIAPAVLAAGVLHLALHSCVGRKALRFEYAALAMLVVVAAAGLGSRCGAVRRERWHTALLFVVHGALWVFASAWYHHAGPVQAAEAIRRDAAFDGDLWLVDGDETAIGGMAYLAHPDVRVVCVARQQLGERLAKTPPDPGTLVLVTRRELEPADAGIAARLEPVAAFTGMFDLRQGERRFLYRWRG